MFGKRTQVPANRIASAVFGKADVAKARDIAWRKMETASSDSDYEAAAAEYRALVA